MFTENQANIHATFLARINRDFDKAQLFFKEDNLVFETDHLKYWLIRREGETIFVESGMQSFMVKRNTNVKKDVIELEVFTKDYSKKYRDSDLLYFIDEGFGISRILWKSNISPEDTTRVFMVAERLLNLIGEDTDQLLISVNPKNMDAVSFSDVLQTGLQSLVVKYRENPSVVRDGVALLDEYDKLHKENHFNKQKFNLMLDGLEQILKYVS